MYAPYQKVYNVGFRVIMEFDTEAQLDAEFARWKVAEKRVVKSSEKDALDNSDGKSASVAPRVTVRAEKTYEGRMGLAMLVDGNPNTKWYDRSFEKGMWISIHRENFITATAYRLVSANDMSGRDPKSWDLFGSVDDGETWVLIDQRSDEKFIKRRQVREFPLKYPEAYNAFKLVINENADRGIQIAEFELVD